jgi:hypothetical protein
MSKRRVPRMAARARPESTPRSPKLVVVTMTCDNDECGGRCIPPWYRKRAVSLNLAPRLNGWRSAHVE